MAKILIVDDEKIERNGIKFLLGSRKGGRNQEVLELLEASNGKEACKVLEKEKVDILFTDIKMPFMNGIELVERARELQPDIQMVIFSGYGEFEYAKQAMKFGVENYVLKPVDPEEFHSTVEKLFAKLEANKQRQRDSQYHQNDLGAYYLGKYLYQGTALDKLESRVDTSRWKSYKVMFLLESDDNFFEEQEEQVKEKLLQELSLEMDLLNLSQERELCFLMTECDVKVCAQHISEVLTASYGEKFYVAASRKLKAVEELPEAFRELDMLMENKFYRKKERVFFTEERGTELTTEQYMNDRINRMIEDIHLNDMIHLWEHFQALKKSTEGFYKYSQIYTKFLFFNLVKELYSQQHRDNRQLEESIQQIYQLQTMEEVLAVIQKMLEEFEQRLGASCETARNEVEQAKSYIYAHYSEDISVEILAEKVYLSPGYFSYIFKKETGENLSRFVKNYRIEQAKKRLEDSNMKIVQICQETGFTNVSYFCKSFKEYYGCSPEQFRKGEIRVE